jgi:non-reducing end alpha-L-arabinofuranosidase
MHHSSWTIPFVAAPFATFVGMVTACSSGGDGPGAAAGEGGAPGVAGVLAGGSSGIGTMGASSGGAKTSTGGDSVAPGRGGTASGGVQVGGAAGSVGQGASGASAGGSNNVGGTASGGTSGGATGLGGSTSVGGMAGNAGSTGSAGEAGASGASSTGGAGGATSGPCDIYASGNTPCVAAHSTVRALFGSYHGTLYQVRRASDNVTKDIGVLEMGGLADSGAQDAFCSGAACVVTIIYDQSGHGNHLEYQGQGSSVGGQDKPASATSESLNVSGHKVYSLYVNPGNSYWRDGHATGVPTGSAPEGLYMVTSGTHVNGGCCFDYGNSETDRKADGAGAMDAIYFGTSCWFGGCSGSGPWVQADLEYGLFPGGSSSWNPKQVPFKSKYVTALLKNNGTSRFALKGGDAQSGSLTTLWDGGLPPNYSPMKKQGAIVLGSGGDCCARNTNQSLGTFYEGAMVAGYPSDTTDDSVQKNVAAAGYQ